MLYFSHNNRIKIVLQMRGTIVFEMELWRMGNQA